ncbi:hypothetical protein [Thalassospira sp.]|uniref:hypothetical protein n=1 Tax=Thalassospira sp. TaxID=1912094 RepID=UPI0027366FA0|nr:hypothetical protein [Thalassospira sp.]MDP2697006.1 hypothetical protein [Thalassospira sp.]
MQTDACSLPVVQLLAEMEETIAGLPVHSGAHGVVSSPEEFSLLRSAILLWAGQNAVLTGDAELSRRWMQRQLPDISRQLERILARLSDPVETPQEECREAARGCRLHLVTQRIVSS